MNHPFKRPVSLLALGGVTALLATTALAQPAIEHRTKLPNSGVYELVFNPTDGDVYASAAGARDGTGAALVRLDGDTLEVVETFDTSSAVPYGLALHDATQTLFGTATRVGAISIISLADSTLTVIQAPEGANTHVREISIDQAANKAYATAVGGRGGDAPSQLWVVDGASRSLDRIIDLDMDGATGLALDIAGNRAFITSMTANEVVVVNLENDQIAARYPSGGENAINVAFDAAGDRLFVSHQDTGNLTVLNADTGALLATVDAGEGSLDVAYDANQNRAYVTNRRAGTLTVVDASDYSVLANLETGTLPQTVVTDPATGRVFTTSKAQGAPRGAPAGTVAPEDPMGDTVVSIRP